MIFVYLDTQFHWYGQDLGRLVEKKKKRKCRQKVGHVQPKVAHNILIKELLSRLLSAEDDLCSIWFKSFIQSYFVPFFSGPLISQAYLFF